MNTHEGYSKKTISNARVLLAGGGDKSLADFIGSIQYVSASKKLLVKTAASNASWVDVVTLVMTDESVKQVDNNNDQSSPILLKNGTGTGTITSTSIFADGVTVNPKNNALIATGSLKSPKHLTDNYEISESTASRLSFGSSGQTTAKGINVGDLLVSNAWADYDKVPTNGIFSKGVIRSGVATGTAPFIIASTTLNTNLNADLLDGYHAGNANGNVPVSNGIVNNNLNADMLDGYHNTSFDGYYLTVIDTTSLDSNTWYPVVMNLGVAQLTRIRIENRTSAPGSWNARSDKLMANTIDYTTRGSNWGWIGTSRTVWHAEYGAGSSSNPAVIGNMGQLTNTSNEYIYVRGGAKYNFYLSRPIVPELKTSTYTTSNLSVSPTTTAPSAIVRNNALITDNVASATKLLTARNINDTLFDGSADITTAKWGTARTITIGNTGKSVNGSANVSWTLAEIIGSTAIGSTTKPIYWSGSAFAACTYSLSATVNAGTANRIAYYSGANAISAGSIVTDGGYLGSVSYLTINAAHQTTNRLYVNGTGYFTGQLHAKVAQGTAPLAVTSTTLVSNLNVDLLDGFHASGLFTVFSNAGSQTTRITIGGTQKDLKIDADLLDGYHYNTLYTSINDWQTKVGNTYTITVNGDKDTYYPVVIGATLSKTSPNIISIWKNLGSTTAAYSSGNHSNGTSSMWLMIEGRSSTWDGNGGYFRTIYKSQPYATLISEANIVSSSVSVLCVYLRGGGTLYNISTTYPTTVTVYLSETNIGSSSYPANVTPRTDIGNGGIINGTFYGNASTATKLATARTINGTLFDGTANITTAKWGTARTITIGNTGKSIDGSANVSWSLAEIGAAAASGHKHPFSDITDGTSSSTASGWSHILSNTYGNSLKSILYMCHGGGYGMHLRGYSDSSSIYMLLIYNDTKEVLGVYGDGSSYFGGNIILKGGTTADMTYSGNIHLRISFRNADASQNVDFIFTDYDSYRSPAGIKLVGNQGGEWFEAPYMYSSYVYSSHVYSSFHHSSHDNNDSVLLAGGNYKSISDFAMASDNLVYYTIDASSLSTSNFYPVTFSSTDMELNCEIHSPNQDGAAAYNQNHIHFLLTSLGWTDTPTRFIVLSQGNYDNAEITIGSVGRGDKEGNNCVWVRGGLKYRFRCNQKPTLRSSNYTGGSETFTVGTSLSGGSNTAVSVLWSNTDDYRSMMYVANSIKSTSNIYAANFYTTSDRNKKTNISSFSEHIRKFQLKDTEKWHYGVIAQEVDEMFRDGEEGNMIVNYNSILSFYIGLLENKVKMLEERIKRLESK